MVDLHFGCAGGYLCGAGNTLRHVGGCLRRFVAARHIERQHPAHPDAAHIPLLLFSLGLFQIIINAALLYFVGYVLKPHFFVDTFWDAIWGALIISFISLVLNTLTGVGNARVRVERRSRRSGSDGGNGPVIDV